MRHEVDAIGKQCPIPVVMTKKVIDKVGITKYNVGEISEYAEKMYRLGRYDEVEAEYMTTHRRKRHGN